MSTSSTSSARPMWRPSNDEVIMDRFRQRVNSKYDVNLANYDDLWQWSVENYPDFWETFFHFSDILCSQSYEEVVDRSKGIDDIPEWFRGCKLNYAENLLQWNDDNVAYVTAGEGQNVKEVTFSQLRANVQRLAASLKASGVTVGDRVVGYVPNSSLALEAMLATVSLGAVWSSTSPEFGVTGVLDRFSQIQPKVLFSVNAVQYNDKIFPHLSKLRDVVKGLPSIEKVVIQEYIGDVNTEELTSIPNSVLLSQFESVAGQDVVEELVFAQVPFNHPLFIMYSSGTTGAPKSMVHSVGGTLIQHLKEHKLHGNLDRQDRMLYYTTTGWMMWNWLVSVLGVGASIVLYDGSPMLPTANILWDLVDRLGITVLGTGAKWLSVLEDKQIKPRETHKLTTLHTILSTGSPLKPQSFDYVYNDIKPDVLLGSITGGTDIISCFAGQNPTVPVYNGEIQSRNLGMAMESWNEEGCLVYGESGELVCTKPFPSMPTHFWNDEDGIKYKKAYFSKYEGIWAHGDFCVINSQTRGIVMLGRSDGTLNPNGVRFGSAEIYNIVETFPEVQDSLCVAQLIELEERVVLFLKMVEGHSFSQDLVSRVKAAIRTQLSVRHVPGVVLETTSIPYTVSGKKVEVAVKHIISGQDVSNRGALINPESLDLYYNIPELTVRQ
ncbi:acetoacetyl-CoA synthetase-like [Corticium candelabrum]|uniref:acetoacetyl-CoA synthetase-like n=1 Tax=Corticium candelabrum TaxID=121492 RepID=UPI002E276E82|nr:acetoacetyl-CoA synthetase-like [Corticium candelabrum]